MPLNREVKIIKIPLSDKERLPDYKQSFPAMPRLYLELLENKAKIKQDLINKEYVPSAQPPPQIAEPDKPEKLQKPNNSNRSNSISSSSTETRDSEESRESNSRVESRTSKDENFTDNMQIDEKTSEHSSGSESDSVSERGSTKETESDTESDHDNDRNDRDDPDNRDDLEDRLKELLGDTQKNDTSRSSSKASEKYSQAKSVEHKGSKYTPYDKYKERREAVVAPTLAELEAKGHFQGKAELRDISHIPMSEHDAEDKKRELIFKFNILKKSYPLAAPTIPDYNIHSDLNEMQKSYDYTVRRLSLDSTVDSYKSYLVTGFVLVEYVFGSFLGFDMQGFTQQQIISMHTYEKLLIELGEKSYVPEGSKWPVELRLLFIIIMNASVFIISKMVMQRTGASIINMMNGMNTPQAPPANAKPKRRMRGPNINIDDIPDVDETQT